MGNGSRLRLQPRAAIQRLGATVCALGVGLLLLSGCKVDVTVTIASDSLGAGRVVLDAVLDLDAASAFAGPVGQSADRIDRIDRIDLADLRKAGWEGPGLQRRTTGSATFSLHHRFTTTDEANALLAQLSATDGPFGQLTLTRSRSPMFTTITLRGPGDFRRGLDAFGDAKIAALTGSGAFGLSETEVLRQTNAADINDVLMVKVISDLVGTRATWSLPVGKATPIRSSGQQTQWATIGGAAAAVATLALFVALRSRTDAR